MFRPATLSKKRLWRKCFPVNFAKFLKTCFSFVALKFYVFLVEDFQFSKFCENVDKLDSGTFKRGFTMTFMVKNS